MNDQEKQKRIDEINSIVRPLNEERMRLIEELRANEPPWETKNIYLKRDGNIIGLHEAGQTILGEFVSYESWGNEYDNEHNMLGRGSFRVHGLIEPVALEMEADGWVRFEGPKPKGV